MQKICTLKNIGKNSAKNMHYCICTFGGCQFFQKIKKTSRKVHIFCIFFAYFMKKSKKIAQHWRYAKNMQKICGKYALFQKYLGKVKIVKNCKKPREKCIFSAYFLHISLKIKENCQKLAICKKYAENMRKICTFPKIFGKGQNSQKLQKTSRKVHIFCIFSAYFLHIFCIFH